MTGHLLIEDITSWFGHFTSRVGLPTLTETIVMEAIARWVTAVQDTVPDVRPGSGRSREEVLFNGAAVSLCGQETLVPVTRRLGRIRRSVHPGDLAGRFGPPPAAAPRAGRSASAGHRTCQFPGIRLKLLGSAPADGVLTGIDGRGSVRRENELVKGAGSRH